MNISSALLAG